jgi:hypothetical protein
MTLSRVAEIGELASKHQVVAVVGARGTGKTVLGDGLLERWKATGVTVLRFDAGDLREPYEVFAPLAEALGSRPEALAADRIPEGRTIRLLIDRAEQLYDRGWLASFQERLRALLSSPAARGRVGLVIVGRPAFRQLVGGQASPLLNLGVVVGTVPLAIDEIQSAFEVSIETARAVHGKTGGHPELSAMLVQAVDGDVCHLGSTLSSFVEAHERYLMRLAEDHGLGGLALLGALLQGSGTTGEQELIQSAFGDAFSRGLDTVDDLVASGLIRRDQRRRCSLAAAIFGQAAAVRDYLRVPDAAIPTGAPDHHAGAAALLYVIENRLRELVVERLSRLDPLWWSTCVPEETIAAAESRRRAEADAPASVTQLHPIMYLSLGELIGILEYGRNWQEVFRLATGRTRQALEAPRGMLIAVRNKVAHNRPVTEQDLTALRLGARLLGLVEEAEDG